MQIALVTLKSNKLHWVRWKVALSFQVVQNEKINKLIVSINTDNRSRPPSNSFLRFHEILFLTSTATYSTKKFLYPIFLKLGHFIGVIRLTLFVQNEIDFKFITMKYFYMQPERCLFDAVSENFIKWTSHKEEMKSNTKNKKIKNNVLIYSWHCWDLLFREAREERWWTTIINKSPVLVNIPALCGIFNWSYMAAKIIWQVNVWIFISSKS